MFEKKYENLLGYQNKHSNKRAIICGSGPSINNFNQSKITKNDIIFSCNQSITAIDRSDYFCMTDWAVSESSFFEYGIDHSDNIMCFGNHFFDEPNINRLFEKLKNKIHFLPRNSVNKAQYFQFDLDNLIYGIDVVHVAANFAYITGCNPIVLVGVDLNYSGGKKYCEPKSFKQTVLWWGTKSFDYSSNPSPPTTDIDLNMSYSGWELIKKSNPNIKFLNVNPEGRLTELFETIIL